MDLDCVPQHYYQMYCMPRRFLCGKRCVGFHSLPFFPQQIYLPLDPDAAVVAETAAATAPAHCHGGARLLHRSHRVWSLGSTPSLWSLPLCVLASLPLLARAEGFWRVSARLVSDQGCHVHHVQLGRAGYDYPFRCRCRTSYSSSELCASAFARAIGSAREIQMRGALGPNFATLGIKRNFATCQISHWGQIPNTLGWRSPSWCPRAPVATQQQTGS
jgi:hypothetical protein